MYGCSKKGLCNMPKSKTTIASEQKKMDRRTRYTVKAIKDAYIELLQQKGRNRIHITDVCKLAEINRCTFYLHFDSLEAVENQIMDELASKFTAYVNTQKESSQDRLALSTLFNEQILRDESFLTLLRLSQPDYPFMEHIAPIFKKELRDSLPKSANLTHSQIDLLYRFISGGCAAVQGDWIRRGNVDLKQENAFLDQLVHLCMTIRNS